MNPSFDLKDYIEAAGEASKRARVASLVLVVTCILVFAGLLNSLDSNWMLQRIRSVVNNPEVYLKEKLHDSTQTNFTSEEIKKLQPIVSTALIRSYVNSNYTIKVPFFGVTFDVNDLGLLGGIGLLVSLCYLWFCIVRENDNLKVSFDTALSCDDEKEKRTTYDLLAMNQVLTAPPHGKQRWLLGVTPQFIVILPFFVHFTVVANDFSTRELGDILSSTHTIIIIIAESMLLVAILVIAIMCFLEIRAMAKMWNDYYRLVYHG